MLSIASYPVLKPVSLSLTSHSILASSMSYNAGAGLLDLIPEKH